MSTVSPRSSTSSSPASVRVVSYNVLSSKLARTSHFTKSDPEHLCFANRRALVLDKIDHAIATSLPDCPTVVALQEVCYPFACELHTYFANRGYAFVTGLYGRRFNGYMGVGLAYPLNEFETINVDIERLSDKREGGWPKEPETEDGAMISKIVQSIQRGVASVALRTLKSLRSNIKRIGYNGGPADERDPIDPWDMSEKRFNVLLTVSLRERKSGAVFSVSNYHMPCAFFAPPVMNIHADLAARRVQMLAEKTWLSLNSEENTAVDASVDASARRIPYIFAGDFNILPDSPHYKLLTTGALNESDATYPPAKHGVPWKIQMLPMDSAYFLANSTEPEFTNYAQVKDEEPFIGTLDYIFLSKHEWRIRTVKELPSIADSGGPFPNEEEPSDHLLIYADIELHLTK